MRRSDWSDCRTGRPEGRTCHDFAVPHEHYAVGERHRLPLIMCHVHRRDPKLSSGSAVSPSASLPDIALRPRTTVRRAAVQPAHERPRAPMQPSDARPVAARPHSGLSMSPIRRPRQPDSIFLPISDSAGAAGAQWKRNILPNRQVWIERYELEHHTDIALGWRQIGNWLAIKPDLPRRAACWSPRRNASAVVLPQPDGPKKTTNSPWRSVMVKPSTAVTSPKSTLRFSISTVAMAPCLYPV